MKPPIAYYGAKINIGQQIADLLPPHKHYVEPYAGSLAVLMAKRPSRMETVNDLDGDLMTFWRVLRDRPEDLERVCALTPHSRAEHEAAYEDVADELEQARRVWVRLTQGRAGTLRKTGWRYYVDPRGSSISMAAYLEAYVDRLAQTAQRLHAVSLECKPGLEVIAAYGQHPEALLYVDPPYLGSTRARNYRHEMSSDAEHLELAEALNAARAAVVLSGYDSPLYLDAYAGWHRHGMQSVDAIVTDPPYNLPGGFMGREWDRFEHGRAFQAWCEEWAAECLRILKPGGFLLAFGGTRTWHRLVSAIEDAGFEIRDSTAALTGQDAPGLMWAHGQGFPKSHDVSKAIDKAAGAKRKVIGIAADFARDGAERSTNGDHVLPHGRQDEHGFRDRWSAPVTSAATDDAADWQGWGTALKPAWEPIAVARKPLSRTVAENVLTYGTGALNIDACRTDAGARPLRLSDRSNGNNTYGDGLHGSYAAGSTDTGRWPTNLVLTHSAACGEACVADCPVAELDRQSGTRPGFSSQRDLSTYVDRNQVYGRGIGNITPGERQGFNDSGGASRFFPVFRYEAKAPTSERPKADGVAHETVKPLDLMKFLVRLVTQPGGTVLDPFLGSGTTAEACVIEGFTCIGIEREEKYIPLIKARLSKPLQAVLGFEEPA